MRIATEGYERQLWDELNWLLADAVPQGVKEAQATFAENSRKTTPSRASGAVSTDSGPRIDHRRSGRRGH